MGVSIVMEGGSRTTSRGAERAGKELGLPAWVAYSYVTRMEGSDEVKNFVSSGDWSTCFVLNRTAPYRVKGVPESLLGERNEL